MRIRIEHILAIVVTGMFLLVDLAVLFFFVSALDVEPNIIRNHVVAEHGYVKTPELNLSNLTRTTFGGTVEDKVEAVRELEETLSTQLQTLTRTDTAP